MSDYQQVLLAVDFEGDQSAVTEKAIALTQQFKASLTLVHVVEYMPTDYAAEPFLVDDIGLDQMLLNKAEEQLSALADRIDLPQLAWRVELGSAKHEVTRVAQEIGADLIIVGSHGRHGLQLLLGSTANGVLHLSHCDVLAVRLKA